MDRTYVKRSADRLIDDLLSELPALLIVGPRATGKTTTALRHAADVVRLDRPKEAAAFQADPDAALRGLKEPVLLDEWQVVPEILGAVKRSVDENPAPGRYLLTGSVRSDLEADNWPGTGRLVRVALYGMTVAEQLGRPEIPSLFDRLARGDELKVPAEIPDLRDYLDLACRGGFPEPATGLSEPARARWIESYIEQVLTRDAAQADTARDPARLRRYFEAYATNSAGVVDEKTLYESAGVNRKTGIAYEQLLRNLLVVDQLPPWSSNRLKRLVRSPKRHLIDPALLAGAWRLNADAILRDGDLLGRMLDTFVTSQLRAETTIAEVRPRLYHLRDEGGRHEIDLVAELGGGKIIGIEIKGGAAPKKEDARHLLWLREKMGDDFLAGVILHTGPRVYSLEDRIIAAPIATLWAA